MQHMLHPCMDVLQRTMHLSLNIAAGSTRCVCNLSLAAEFMLQRLAVLLMLIIAWRMLDMSSLKSTQNVQSTFTRLIDAEQAQLVVKSVPAHVGVELSPL